jgi:hypothetical protein
MIPKRIHYCWLSNDPYTPLVEECITSWKKFLPNYEFILWDMNNPEINQHQWVKEAFAEKKYAFAADYIRLYAVYHYGGIYLDSDVEILQSFDSLLDQPSFIGFESSGDLEPAVFGAHPKMDWVQFCLDYYHNRPFKKEDGKMDMIPLPMVIQRQLEAFLNIKIESQHHNSLKKVSNNLVLYPSRFFSPKNYQTQKVKLSPETMAIHHFDGNWVNNSILANLKVLLHRFLYSALGEKGHYAVITLIRKMNA